MRQIMPEALTSLLLGFSLSIVAETGLLCLVAGLLDASPLPRFKLAEVQLLRTGRAIQAAHRR